MPQVDSDGHLIGLPTRVPRANLAPQLRHDTESSLAAGDVASAGPTSPEEARRAMTDMQRGWQRGWSGDTTPGDPASEDATPGS